MKKATIYLVLIAMIASLLTGCCLSHDWKPATCEAPSTCAKCGETEGEALEHIWKNATCTEPKTCNRCAATEGEPLAHSWEEATCTAPKACTVCAETEGAPLGHTPGEWIVTEEPDGGVAGKQVRYCTVCDEVAEEEDYFYSYFDMSFDEFMQVHNSTYRSEGWQIKKVDTGFAYLMDGEDFGLVFHEDLNTKESGTITAYSTASLEKFNQVTFRVIVNGSSYIDTDNVTVVLMLGSLVFQPLIGYEAGAFIDDFTENMEMTRSGDSLNQWEATIDGYKYILCAYPVDGYYSRVFYEFECVAI